jgi:hypothetical protein
MIRTEPHDYINSHLQDVRGDPTNLSFGSVAGGKLSFRLVGVWRIGGTGFLGSVLVATGVGNGGGNSDAGVIGIVILILTGGSSAGRYIRSASLSMHQRTS